MIFVCVHQITYSPTLSFGSLIRIGFVRRACICVGVFLFLLHSISNPRSKWTCVVFFSSFHAKVAKIKEKIHTKRVQNMKICMYVFARPTTTSMQKNDQGEAHASEILNANK